MVVQKDPWGEIRSRFGGECRRKIIAGRETSGKRVHKAALKVRQNRLSHLQCENVFRTIQTFHVWLLSDRTSGAKTNSLSQTL
jgi:hypothetical protein